MKACDQGLFACGVYLDLKKAFDTFNHNILLSKLHHYGIRGKANDWFKSFLVNRNQYISLNNTNSSSEKVMYGVPQGSDHYYSLSLLMIYMFLLEVARSTILQMIPTCF